MVHVERIDEERRGACSREGGSNLGVDMSAFANTCHDDLAFAVLHQVHSLLKTVIKLGYQT
jgi:hypothetical protein